jgi:TatD DNase family protein
MDLFWDKTFLIQQQLAFQYQIQLDKKYKLGINIHCRDAFDETFEVLESEKATDLFGIFHCFTGDLDQAQRAISLGMKLGIGGVSTFKNGIIDQFLHKIDLQHIVLETDSPYLAPAPHRGKRNESSYLKYIVEKVAEIKNCPIEKVAKITSQNAEKIFGL